MEPPKPYRKDEVLRNAPDATPADYEEYERLLSRHFAKGRPRGNKAAAAPDPDEARLKELTKKLFGTS